MRTFSIDKTDHIIKDVKQFLQLLTKQMFVQKGIYTQYIYLSTLSWYIISIYTIMTKLQ